MWVYGCFVDVEDDCGDHLVVSERETVLSSHEVVITSIKGLLAQVRWRQHVECF